ALEVTVPAVAANNLVAIQKEEDLFDSNKKIKTATTKALGVKFFSSQKRAIAMNEILLNLYQNKFAACRDAARQLLKTQPDNDALYLILAATMHKQKKTAKALEELKEYAQLRPESVAIEFAIVQLELVNGSDYVAAIESLQKFLKGLPAKEQHCPGYVALLVWLYDQAGQSEKGVELLSEASAVWAKGSSSTTMPLTLLRQTAAFKLRSHRFREAAKDYEELVRADPSDPASIAGLIMAYSEFEPALAEKYGASLPEMRSTMDLDVEALERVVPGLKREYVTNVAAGADGVAFGSGRLRRGPGSRPRLSGARRLRKRKPLLPKNYDSSVTADPERWLPKRDRAAARLARTRKTGAGSKKDMGKGPQGLNMEGGGIGGTGSARIAGRELPKPVAAAAPVVAVEEVVDVAAIAKAKSSSSNKKKKGKGKVLAIDAKDQDALHCKAITLIRLERYADALVILNRALEGKLVFEQAYCLYRTNQLSDGASLIEKRRNELKAQGQALTWDLRHLEAQMLYRMERYQECIELYHGMLKDTPKTDEGYNDILTNFNACKAAVLYSGETLDDKWKIEDVTQTTYELSFNSACARISTGDYAQALVLLEEAKSLCRAALEDYDEEEIEQEMAIIVVQTAFVHQLLGHIEKARELYHSVLKIKY
ncbi:Signal recognition particle core component, partial [Podila epigama]